jgi:hypothetical protein
MTNDWRSLKANRQMMVFLIMLVATGVFFVAMFSKFMIWNEHRPGSIFCDPVMSYLGPVNMSRVTMSLTLVPICLGMILIFRKPVGTIYFFYTAIFICILRTLTLYFIPLEPPPGIIPLTDPVIEKLFYGNNVLVKDLFFSGHTANLIIIGLLSDIRQYRNIVFICAGIVGFLLILQHVHFSIDVAAAPFFAILAYKLSIMTANKTLLKNYSHMQWNGNVFSNLNFLSKA